jgi:acyl CoA:acetate/3-ketoacid CoA transferase alpha subunit
MNHRRLNPRELEDGMYVQCGGFTTNGDVEFSDIVYKLIKIDPKIQKI